MNKIPALVGIVFLVGVCCVDIDSELGTETGDEGVVFCLTVDMGKGVDGAGVEVEGIEVLFKFIDFLMRVDGR